MEQSGSEIKEVLEARGKEYGPFDEHARITQGLKAIMKSGRNWERLRADQKESLEMICHKAGRILNGNPDYVDSWKDMEGYIRLITHRLESEEGVLAVSEK